MINEIIQETQNFIPNKLKHDLSSMQFREHLFEIHGPKAFLDPYNLRYPIYDLEGFNENLCFGAYVVSKDKLEFDITNKAKSLFEQNNKDLTIHIADGQDMDLISFIDLFEYSLSDMDFIEII